jgi:hypothetical protein
MRIALSVLASLMLFGLVFSVLLVLVRVWAIRADAPADPAPLRLVPPASPVARLHARATTCRQHGHTYRLAFPMGRLAQQCSACGAIAPRLVVKSHRARA